MKILKKILDVIFYTVFLLILMINFVSILTTGILKKDYPLIFGYTYFEIASNSMMPELKKGDVVIVKLNCNDYKVGDIITFKDTNFYTTHRIEQIESNNIITKGDSNNIQDDPTAFDNVVGKVIFKITGLGILLHVFKNPIIIVIIVLLFLVMAFFDKKTKNEGK